MKMEPIIDLYRNDNQAVINAFDQIVVNIFMHKEKKQHKSFVICGCNPGAGTTSTAVELAISLSVAGWKTVLVDADLRKESQYKRLNQKVQAGLSDYIVGKTSEQSVCNPTNWPGLDYIACGRNREETSVKLLCSVRMGELMKELERDYDFILFDVPSLNSAVDAKILAAKADCTFLVVESEVTTFKNLSHAKQQLEEVGANVAGVIANKLSMEEYRKVVKDYDYFHAKAFLSRQRSSAADLKERKKRKKERTLGWAKRLFGCLALTALLSTVCSGHTYAAPGSGDSSEQIVGNYGQNASTGMLPALMVSGYSITEGVISAGEEFTLDIQMRNENRYIGAYQVYMTLYSQTDGIYLQPGETNQRYVEYIPPGGTASFQIRMAVSEQINSDKALLEIRFDYVNETGNAGTNTTSISPAVRANAKLEILSVTAADYVNVGARALLNIQYANSGQAQVKNVQLKIEGNIEENQKTADLEVPEVGQQEYLDCYVIFTESGNQQLTVTLTYEDNEGGYYEVEPEHLTVLVAPGEGDRAGGTPPLEEPETDVQVQVSEERKVSADGKIAVAVGSVIVLLAAIFWIKNRKGICLISLKPNRDRRKESTDGTSKDR